MADENHPSTPTSLDDNAFHDPQTLKTTKPGSALPIASSEAAQIIAAMSPEEYALAERHLLRKVSVLCRVPGAG